MDLYRASPFGADGTPQRMGGIDMAKVYYMYFFGCYAVMVNDKCIGKTHDKAQAHQWAQDYNELHKVQE